MGRIVGTMSLTSTGLKTLRKLAAEFAKSAGEICPNSYLTHEAEWTAGHKDLFPGNITSDVMRDYLAVARIKLYDQKQSELATFDVRRKSCNLEFSVEEAILPSLQKAVENKGGSILIAR